MRARLLLTLLLTSFASAADFDANQLSWLTGCWTLSRGPLLIEEHWSKPTSGHIIGFSRTTRGGKAASWEFLTILTSPTGDITYNPRLSSNQPPVAFKLVKQSDSEVTFENLTHDFPQRIIYRKSPEGDSLHARIEGEVQGKLRSQEFPYRRASCQ